MLFSRTIVRAAVEAGSAILEVYKTDFDIALKKDRSPLTKADKVSHKLIINALKKTGFPILSEEGKKITFAERQTWNKFWLIDPLDGTKEFIKRNGEFTVNIALIENGEPVIGVVYAPVLDVLYIGGESEGAWKIENASKIDMDDWQSNALPLPINSANKKLRVVASRSHLNRETEDFINNLKTKTNVELVSKGSSLKLCLIAEGTAEIYPRFAPTMEWDTAAGHAIINASGGKVVKTENETKKLEYNKEDLLNPWFIAYSKDYLKNNPHG